MNSEVLLDILKEHTFITVGCTDPVAAGLSAAIAYKAIGGDISSIEIVLDKNIYKDAISVGIPGTMRTGLDLAVSLAVLFGDPNKGLSLLENIDEKCIFEAEKLLEDHSIVFSLNENAKGIYVKSIVKTTKGVGTALLMNSHDNLVEVTVNGRATYSKNQSSTVSDPLKMLSSIENLTVNDIFSFIDEIDPEKLSFLNEGVETNLHAAALGEKQRAGIGTGVLYQEMIEKHYLSDDVVNRTKQKVGAGADARMSGMNVPIFGCFGSGNHGITLFTTMGMMAKHLDIEQEEVSKALAVSLLIIGIIKTRTGILTPHCGCSVAAGTGAAAGIVYMLGGREKEVESAVNLMMADLTGMLCDGAKYGCALKMITAAGAAIESAYMAILGAEVPGNNGIVGWTLGKTMNNLRTVTQHGMSQVDRSVLEILLNSSCQR